jgi:cytochrome P450
MLPKDDTDEDNETGMTRGEILASMRVLLVAGSETSASILSGTTYFLLTHPHWLKRVQAEVHSVFSTPDEITLNALYPNNNNKTSLPLLEAVLQESFRCYPPTPTIFPRVTGPEGVVIDGKFVPANTSVGVHQWAAYRSASNFVAPERWDPVRWLEGEEGYEQYRSDDRGVLQPFSVGPRGCIGKR